MKLLKLLISGLGLALALSTASAADLNWNDWTQSYYRHPEPGQLADAVTAGSRTGAFDQENQVAANIGFLATVFARNPDRVDGWMRAFDRLPLQHRRLVVAALWYSGLPQGETELRVLAQGATPEIEASLTRMLKQPRVAIADTPVLSESSLNLQWGAFLASGEPKHIVNALAALGSGQGGLSETARFSLAQKAAAHERVFAICQDELARQPAGVRDGLRAALADARPTR